MPDVSPPTPPSSLLAISTPRQAYNAPQLRDLGTWQALTLIYTLPIGPGGRLPANTHDSDLF